MRRLALLLAALTAATPAAAQTYGGGGISAHQTVIPWDVPGQYAPNALGCVGGIGYGVSNGRRAGGEGHLCGGPFGGMAWGGAHFGLQSKRAGAWLTGYNTVGAGWIGVHGPERGRFDGAFVFTRPTVGAGFGIGRFAALEGAAFLMLPLNVIGVAREGIQPQFTFPHVGLQATLLFGNFGRKPPAVPAEPPPPQYQGYPPPPQHRGYPPPPPPREGPPPAPAGQRQAPIQPGDLPPANRSAPAPDDDRPLAIPG